MHRSLHHCAIPRLCCSLALILGLLGVACKENLGPNTPSVLRRATSANIEGTVGVALSPAPTFVVVDADGRAVAGAAVTITVIEGGGTIAGAPTTSLNGPTPVGTWTLGTRTGRNVLRVEVAGVPVLDIVATALAGAPTSIVIASGDGQTGLAGAELPQPLVFQVVDQFGNGVPAVTVLLSTGNVGGSVSSQAVVADQDGRTPSLVWRLGRLGDEQLLTAVSGPLSVQAHASTQTAYNIDVRFTASTPTAYQGIFLSASRRIGAIVVGDVPDEVLVGVDASTCGGPPGQTLDGPVDDVIIIADVFPIDGPGKILGRAGPCFVRNTSLLTLVGFMQFDEADVAAMAMSGRLESVITHEMLHVLGVGGLWRVRGLLENAGTTDPRYNGPGGISGCGTIGFGVQCTNGAPVENTGGTGTAESHWRETIFDTELMTGFADNPPMPFSAMTAGSLEDLGYGVNYLAVDPFSPAMMLWQTLPRVRPTDEYDVVLLPKGTVGRDGRVVSLTPP